jgi:membrane fusion protein (multidrug efflux system)
LVRVTSDAYADRVFEGKVTAINADVDPVTRNVRIQATLANGGGELRPGMFVSVDVVLPESEAVLAVPATAIVYASYGNSIFLAVEGEAGPDGVKPLLAEQRTVRLGLRRGDFVAVTAGVNAGEKIVTNGAFKLRTGTPLVPSSQGVTAPELNPKPADM